MQLIIINECAFKMILSSAEMKEYGIDEDEFHISGCQTRQVLKEIIKSRPEGAALQNIHENEKLIIQLWQKEDGGCELFVTRLPLESDFLEENGMTDKNDSNLPIPGTKKEAPRRRRALTYSFSELEWVKAACRALLSRSFEGRSELYETKEDALYLVLYPLDTPESRDSPTSYLSEFGELENSEHMLLYLCEHGECILRGNAIEALAKE